MILYISAAWGLLGVVIAFATRGSAEDAIREAATTPLTEDEISAAATVSIVIAAVFAIGFAVLYYLCGKKMLEGRNWARIVPTVLIGIGVLFGLLSLTANTGGGLYLVSQLIGLALGIAFLVFAWNRDSNEFFKTARTPR